MRSTTAALLALAVFSSAGASAAELSAKAARALEKRAHAKMGELDYEAAAPLLQRAVKSSALPSGERARAYVDLGVALVNVGKDGEAQRAFAHALALDPKVALPADASPKIQGIFEAEARAVAPRLEAPVPQAPPPPPPPVVRAPPPVAAPPPAPTAAIERPAPSAPSRSLAAPIALGATAAIALGVGIWAAGQSAGAAHSLQASLNSTATVNSLVARQGTFATVSIVSYVVAAAAAIAGVSVYALEGRPGASGTERQDSTFSSASVAPFAFSF
ncbi:MAG: hypothetical protein ACYCWW_02380 [Deltaproteobacteria bacterium]